MRTARPRIDRSPRMCLGGRHEEINDLSFHGGGEVNDLSFLGGGGGVLSRGETSTSHLKDQATSPRTKSPPLPETNSPPPIPGHLSPPRPGHPPSKCDRMTDACENITFACFATRGGRGKNKITLLS